MSESLLKSKRILVIGASINPSRYSYMAVTRLVDKRYDVYALGRSQGSLNGVHIDNSWNAYENIDTVTLYINSTLQKEYYSSILELKPRRIIFNPGSENAELALLASQNGIEVLNACNLVMLSAGTF